MFVRVKAALLASNLLEKYEKQFEDNSLEDSMVDHCLVNTEDMHILADVIPSAGHRLQFLTEFRKVPKPSPSSLSPQPDLKRNVPSEAITEKKELEYSKARLVVEEAEKLYMNQMAKYLDTCKDKSDLLVKEAQVSQEIINYLNGKIQTTNINSEFIQQLKKELKDFISNWFKSQLELFQLKRDKAQVIVQNALITAKAYYNDEMEKHFQTNNFIQPSTLVQLDEQISSAAMKNTVEKHKDLKMTPRQQAQLEEAMKLVFKKYKEKNLLRKPAETPAIGIDLGTTYSCVAVVINGKVEVLSNEYGAKTTPSYVVFQDDGTVITGDAAKDQSYRNPQNTIFDSKRLIGRKFSDPQVQKSIKSWPFEVIDVGGKPKIRISSKNDSMDSNLTSKKMKLNVSCEESLGAKTYHPEEISAEILKKMKQIAEDYLGTKVESAVVTVPALFNDSQRQATKDAAEIAGLKVLRIINEPTAAAIAYQLHRMDDLKRNVLVFDLGGGTFDVAVLKITGGEIEIKAVHGDTHLGGEDFDAEMVQVCIDHFQKTNEVDLTQGRESPDASERYFVSRRLRSIRNECEKQKRTLSCNETTVVHLDLIDSIRLDLDVPFTREMFESINQKYFDKCIKTVEKVLEEAEMTKFNINDIVLVGGSTKIPKIQRMLKDFFEGKELSKRINPDESVAVGAAIQACLLIGEKVAEFEDSPLKLMDVTPFCIGMKNYDKKLLVHFPKNSRIPCEHTEIWSPVFDFQTRIRFKVYEGENPIAARNNLLGTFILDGIPSNKAWKEKVKATMRISEEGILSVEAICESNGATNNIEIVAYKDRLTPKQIDKAKVCYPVFETSDSDTDTNSEPDSDSDSDF